MIMRKRLGAAARLCGSAVGTARLLPGKRVIIVRGSNILRCRLFFAHKHMPVILDHRTTTFQSCAELRARFFNLRFPRSVGIIHGDALKSTEFMAKLATWVRVARFIAARPWSTVNRECVVR